MKKNPRNIVVFKKDWLLSETLIIFLFFILCRLWCSIVRKALRLLFMNSFLGPTSLSKPLRLSNFTIFSMGYIYILEYYVYSFWQIVNALRFFKALHLFFLANYPSPTFISCPTSILDSRVGRKLLNKREAYCPNI